MKNKNNLKYNFENSDEAENLDMENLEAVMDFAGFNDYPQSEDEFQGFPYLSEEEHDDLNSIDDEIRNAESPNINMSSPFSTIKSVKIELPEYDSPEFQRMPIIRMDHACATPYIPMSLPLTIEENEEAISNSIESGKGVIILFQDPGKYVKGKSKGLSRVGVWAQIMQKVPPRNDDRFPQILVISGPRLKVEKFNVNKGRVTATVRMQDWLPPTNRDERMQQAALFHELVDSFDRVQKLDNPQNQMMPSAEDLLHNTNEGQFVSTILFSLGVNAKIKNDILCEDSMEKVCISMLQHLSNLSQLLELRRDINSRVNQKLNEGQRENFIQHQIELLQQEIGNGSASDIDNLKKRSVDKIWPEDIKVHFDKELGKLSRLSPNSPDYSIQYAYLDTFLSLPWGNESKTDYTLQRIEDVLNEDHFGLERVKERILEQMAVSALRKDNKSPIICLVGPPGVGKTSLGKSIAKAMGREYGRVAFGGLHDEAEIRGHRRTYIGAMPGRIITALLKTSFSNPVIVLDEIDKIGKDYKGDPSTALLEVLDPEQNSHFHDNYIDADYDLSKILFIATANSLETVSGPLRDRMEIISIPGYIAAEKIEIAKRHLISKQLEANGMKDESVTFTDEALSYIIEYYTRESGVRKLEKTIGKVLRKLAVKKVRGQEFPHLIEKSTVSELLGKEEYNPEMYENNNSIGVVTGLAWTQVGGEILFIESTVTEGKGKLTLTGNLGDVMKESATLALQYLKSHASTLGLDQNIFDKSDVHIHVPEGAIPKDGPSAGITMATSLASSFTGMKVRPKLAMTGEITLRGKVLPVGGIREKIIAAKRAGINQIILSKENEKDILEVKPEYLEGLTFTYVDNVAEVLELALLKE